MTRTGTSAHSSVYWNSAPAAELLTRSCGPMAVSRNTMPGPQPHRRSRGIAMAGGEVERQQLSARGEDRLHPRDAQAAGLAPHLAGNPPARAALLHRLEHGVDDRRFFGNRHARTDGKRHGGESRAVLLLDQ